MRLLPIALIVIGTLGVARYFDWIPAGMLPLVGPALLIALGVALLFRRPRACRGDGRWRRRGGPMGASPAAPDGR